MSNFGVSFSVHKRGIMHEVLRETRAASDDATTAAAVAATAAAERREQNFNAAFFSAGN